MIEIQFILSFLGMLSLPIIAFLIDEAYRRTGNMNRLMIRSFGIALLAAFPYRYAFFAASDSLLPRSFFSGALTSFCCLGLILFYDKMKTDDTHHTNHERKDMPQSPSAVDNRVLDLAI
jgi:hypothetical protein